MERKIVLAIFAPALVALAMRIALFILALPIFELRLLNHLFNMMQKNLRDSICLYGMNHGYTGYWFYWGHSMLK